LQLLYYEADSDLANAMRPSWDEHSYRHVDVVAADRVFADINDAVVNSETRSVAVTHRGVYFAFYDQVGLRHATCVADCIAAEISTKVFTYPALLGGRVDLSATEFGLLAEKLSLSENSPKKKQCG